MLLRARCLVTIVIGVALAGSTARAAQPGDAGPPLIDLMRDRVLASLALQPDMSVAEIGIGGGWFVIRVAEAIGPKGIVYGTDIDREAIAKLKGKLTTLSPSAAPVELRLCTDGRDTALDDLPDDRLDLITMVDSLCFDAQEPRQRNVAYLRGFLRLLRPGGRLVHHMDCRCDVTAEALVAQFAEAGFSPQVEIQDVAPTTPVLDPDWPCKTEAERKRHGLVFVFRKPAAAAGAAPASTPKRP